LPIQVCRWFPAVLALLLPMALWAVWVRIDDYGLTPFRVGRLMMLCALLTMSVFGIARLLWKKGPVTWEAPLIAIAFAIPTAVGPLSAVSLSIDSQQQRLQALLQKHGIEPVLPARTSKQLDWEDSNDFYTTIQVLIDLGGTDALQPVLRGDLSQCHVAWACREGLGITDVPYPRALPNSEYLLTDSVPLPRGSYRTFEMPNYRETPQGSYTLQGTAQHLELFHGSERVGKLSLIKDGRPLLGEFVAFTGSANNLGGLVVTQASYRILDSGIQMNTFSGIWLLPAGQ
jgi:hypothetical protein